MQVSGEKSRKGDEHGDAMKVLQGLHGFWQWPQDRSGLWVMAPAAAGTHTCEGGSQQDANLQG